jgi:hypothetical protein
MTRSDEQTGLGAHDRGREAMAIREGSRQCNGDCRCLGALSEHAARGQLTSSTCGLGAAAVILFSMTDDQLQALCELAEPLPPELRSELLRLTAVELAGQEPGDGSLARAARIALIKIKQAERLVG